MILLQPIPEIKHQCPFCKVDLIVRDWLIPGMRMLADMVCTECGKEYFGDLLAGHGLYYPMLLEKDNGKVHDKYGVHWFASWLETSYQQRSEKNIEFEIEEFKILNKIVLLNCLDVLYGHCLLKLLNAQYYIDNCQDYDLVVIVPRFLRWMVPEGVAAVWTVDLPLNQGIEWNESLNRKIHKVLESHEKVYLSVALSHPHPNDFSIERFSRVTPFDLDSWKLPIEQPVVSFVWRENRCWTGGSKNIYFKVKRLFGNFFPALKKEPRIQCQNEQVILFANQLRKLHPDLNFSVIGLGTPGGLPAWIGDMRKQRLTDTDERDWCQKYKESHVVVGVHGSNMLLPSAHAAATVELVPRDRWSNLIQDILPRVSDGRVALFMKRFIPLDCDPNVLTACVSSLLVSTREMMIYFSTPYVDHSKIQASPSMVSDATLKNRQKELFTE